MIRKAILLISLSLIAASCSNNDAELQALKEQVDALSASTTATPTTASTGQDPTTTATPTTTTVATVTCGQSDHWSLAYPSQLASLYAGSRVVVRYAPTSSINYLWQQSNDGGATWFDIDPQHSTTYETGQLDGWLSSGFVMENMPAGGGYQIRVCSALSVDGSLVGGPAATTIPIALQPPNAPDYEGGQWASEPTQEIQLWWIPPDVQVCCGLTWFRYGHFPPSIYTSHRPYFFYSHADVQFREQGETTWIDATVLSNLENGSCNGFSSCRHGIQLALPALSTWYELRSRVCNPSGCSDYSPTVTVYTLY